jgi:hypothetical protein
VANDDISMFLDDEVVARLSVSGELVVCSVEEHAMCSAAFGWRDGKRIWSIEHVSEEGRDHRETSGTLPPRFAEIRDGLLRDQEHGSDEVDTASTCVSKSQRR